MSNSQQGDYQTSVLFILCPCVCVCVLSKEAATIDQFVVMNASISVFKDHGRNSSSGHVQRPTC